MNSGLTALRPATRPIDLARAALRAAGHVAFAALVVFHAWLLGLVLLAALAQSGRPLAGGRPSFPVPALIAGLPSTGLALRFSSRPLPLA